MKNDRLLMVFVKNAELGKAKTRLAATVGNHEALRGNTSASANSISLTPIQTGSTAVNGSTDGGKPIASWRCGPAATKPLPLKYLPASCKAS